MNQDRGARATQAKEIIANPLFRNIVKEMGETYFSDWVIAETLEERERLHSKMTVLSDVIDELNGTIAMNAGDGQEENDA